jgi:GcrA cell cycle regulator
MPSRDVLWTEEITAALRQCMASKMTFEKAADALNARFGKAYSRSAIGGRCWRIKLKSLNPAAAPAGKPQERTPARVAASEARRIPIHRRVIQMSAPIRCDDPEALNVPMVELRDSHCRWPVSGERAHTLFCGRLRLEASSYCPRHHDLSVGRGTYSERVADRLSDKVA